MERLSSPPEVSPWAQLSSPTLCPLRWPLLHHSHWASMLSTWGTRKGTRQSFPGPWRYPASHAHAHTCTHVCVHTHNLFLTMPPFHPYPHSRQLPSINKKAMILYPQPPLESSTLKSHTHAGRKLCARTDGTSHLQCRRHTHYLGPCKEKREGRWGEVVGWTGITKFRRPLGVGSGDGHWGPRGYLGTQWFLSSFPSCVNLIF